MKGLDSKNACFSGNSDFWVFFAFQPSRKACYQNALKAQSSICLCSQELTIFPLSNLFHDRIPAFDISH